MRTSNPSVVLVLALAGCDSVFGLQRPDPIDAAPIDARICPLTTAPPAEDLDGDGRINAVDNCTSTPNPDQNDEDADCLGDVCDLCPWLPDGPTDDPDDDQIAGPCDDDPGVKNNLVFDGFSDSLKTNQTWAISPGLTVAGGQLVVNTPSVGWAGSLTVNVEKGAIDLGFHIPAATLAANTDFFVGAEVLMHVGPDPNAASGYVIGLAREAGRNWLRIALRTPAGFDPPRQAELLDASLEAIVVDDGPLRLHVAASGANAGPPGKLAAALWVRGAKFELTVDNPLTAGTDSFGVYSQGTGSAYDYAAFLIVR